MSIRVFYERRPTSILSTADASRQRMSAEPANIKLVILLDIPLLHMQPCLYVSNGAQTEATLEYI